MISKPLDRFTERRVPVLVSREESHIISRVPSELLSELSTISDLYYIPQMDIQPLSPELLPGHLMKFPSKTILFVFTSSSSIDSVLPLCRPEYQYAIIGEGTASTLRENGVIPDFIPSVSNQEVFAHELTLYLKTQSFEPKIFIFQGSTASTHLADYLGSKGFNVERHLSYQVTERSATNDEIAGLEQFLFTVSGRISESIIPGGYMVFFSSLQVEFFFKRISDFFKKTGQEPNAPEILANVTALAIGPKTADTLINKGCTHVIAPDEQNNRILFEFLLKNIKINSSKGDLL